MRLSVAYNGDTGLIGKLKDIGSVVNVFGSESKSVTGGGRSSFALPHVTESDIGTAVRIAHQNNIQFNYVMNSACMGNKEYTEAKLEQIMQHLDWLCDIGADWVTLANPFIIDVCRKRHPRFKISLSSFVTVESVQRARFYDDIGVNEITVRENINRSFSLLKEMKRSVRCDIQLLANQACLFQCPYQIYHCNFVSHASQVDDPSSAGQVDYCILRCNHYRFSNPAELIKSCWIRPEDICAYEEIGIDKLKLSDRSSTTDFLLRAATAYDARHYDGNLTDIFNLCIGMNRQRNPGSESKPVAASGEEVKKMRALLKAFARLDVSIDNRKLSGFLDFFKHTDCKASSCDLCGYCDEIAGRVVSFPHPLGIEKALEEIKSIVDSMTTPLRPAYASVESIGEKNKESFIKNEGN
jgi:collagenase-like PrtC family protease